MASDPKLKEPLKQKKKKPAHILPKPKTQWEKTTEQAAKMRMPILNPESQWRWTEPGMDTYRLTKPPNTEDRMPDVGWPPWKPKNMLM